jgi:hypothetical protein
MVFKGINYLYGWQVATKEIRLVHVTVMATRSKILNG